MGVKGLMFVSVSQCLLDHVNVAVWIRYGVCSGRSEWLRVNQRDNHQFIRRVSDGRLQTTITKMMSSLSLLLLGLQVMIVVVAGSWPAPAGDRSDEVDGCYVVTIFGLKTADCGKQRARSVPTDLDSHLQVSGVPHFIVTSSNVYAVNVDLPTSVIGKPEKTVICNF